MHHQFIVAERIPARSNRAEVRNPILTLPAVARLRALDPETRAILQDLLLELQQDARQRAEASGAAASLRSPRIGRPAGSMRVTSPALSDRAPAAASGQPGEDERRSTSPSSSALQVADLGRSDPGRFGRPVACHENR